MGCRRTLTLAPRIRYDQTHQSTAAPSAIAHTTQGKLRVLAPAFALDALGRVHQQHDHRVHPELNDWQTGAP
ncbi:hypothetical protein F7R91_39755 [Streptomyces luteolifulvus]|uniref:Uncharacterized protein n=1 Tax=Streptomyces luteolifulvus TaxID=2615112 RepID=A0A6H9UNR2_9ACTN|nr:hypothetical protein [Streptomyces luteolifulvus]KAB1139486.1 hypothetical protein F7R91_39755 [Streptomyces luteolifulvus]